MPCWPTPSSAHSRAPAPRARRPLRIIENVERPSARTRRASPAHTRAPQPACRIEAVPSMRRRDHRPALRQRLEQHQALGLGARGEHEHVGGRIAVGQPALAVQVADEVHLRRDAQLQPPAAADARAPGPRRRSPACASGRARRSTTKAVQQELNVLLVRHAADVQQQRPIRGDAEAARENARRRPADSDRPADPVGITCDARASRRSRAAAAASARTAPRSRLQLRALRAREARASARPSARGSTGT